MKTLRNDILRKFAPIATILLVGLLCGSAALAGTVDACAVVGGGTLAPTSTVFPPPCSGSVIAAGTLDAWMSASFSYTSTAGTNTGTVYSAVYDNGGGSLKRLILTAYKLKPYQVSGPDWMDSVRFDILSKIPEGGTKDQVPEMLQALLAERFKLTAHRETKEQPVYGLVVGKDGPKLKPSVPDAARPDRRR